MTLGASPAGAALPEASFSCLTPCRAEEEEEALVEEAACLELMDLLLQGLPLLLGCGMAVVVVEEEEEEDGGEMEPEVAAEMLVEEPRVSDEETSVITHGWEVIPSEESAGGDAGQSGATIKGGMGDCQHLLL